MYNFYLNSYLQTKIIHGQLGLKIKEFKILNINFVNVHQIFFTLNIIILQISQDQRQSNCLHPVHLLPFATFSQFFSRCTKPHTFDDVFSLLPVNLLMKFFSGHQLSFMILKLVWNRVMKGSFYRSKFLYKRCVYTNGYKMDH